MTTEIRCTNCGSPYPEAGAPYRCPRCLAPFDLPRLPRFDPAGVDERQPGIWRYRQAFGLDKAAPRVTLGEGNTPLLEGEAFGRRVAFKLEFANPSGSFKDRGAAVAVSFLRSRGVVEAVEDSSGNAGASFAAYAAAAGMRARVFVPDTASGPKRRQIEAYGAEVVRILGSRQQAAEAARRAAPSTRARFTPATPTCRTGWRVMRRSRTRSSSSSARRRGAWSSRSGREGCCSGSGGASRRSPGRG